MPVSEKDFPAVAHTRKHVINKNKPKPRYKLEKELILFKINLAPIKTNIKEIRKLYLLAGTIRFGITNSSLGLDNLKTASPSTPYPKKKDINIPKITRR
jgi:hypothetical protein|tara:strand:- start:106 stop:402 length:297 start_codon:yes stop_codon:yes gene_type:complete